MGPFDVTGVSGLCEGVLFRLIRSVTSTSSPTRRTAPDGPAQAYWPKTGLSRYRVSWNKFPRRDKIGKLTRELLVDSPILRQQSVQLSVCSNHAAFGQIGIQTQATHRAEQTPDRDFLLSIGLGANGEHTPAVLAVRFLLFVRVNMHVWSKSNDDVFTAGHGWQTATSIFFGGGGCEQ